MDCQEIKKIIPKYFQHTATEEEIKIVEEHLCVCHDCRTTLGQLMDKLADSQEESAQDSAPSGEAAAPAVGGQSVDTSGPEPSLPQKEEDLKPLGDKFKQEPEPESKKLPPEPAQRPPEEKAPAESPEPVEDTQEPRPLEESKNIEEPASAEPTTPAKPQDKGIEEEAKIPDEAASRETKETEESGQKDIIPQSTEEELSSQTHPAAEASDSKEPEDKEEKKAAGAPEDIEYFPGKGSEEFFGGEAAKSVSQEEKKAPLPEEEVSQSPADDMEKQEPEPEGLSKGFSQTPREDKTEAEVKDEIPSEEGFTTKSRKFVLDEEPLKSEKKTLSFEYIALGVGVLLLIFFIFLFIKG